MRLPISETFTSIQGEGKLAGVPSHFIRVSGCNLRCTWCDTPYASWRPEHDNQTLQSLLDAAAHARVRHAVITGGEPMIFKHLDALCRGLRELKLHITIETAGTEFRDVECDMMSISPKLRNSTPINDPRDPTGEWARLHEERRINIAALQALLNHYPTRQLKFVVSCDADLGEIDNLLARLTGWSADDVLLMPEGVIPPTSETKAWVSQTCIARSWRYCPRLHIDLYGNRRGT